MTTSVMTSSITSGVRFLACKPCPPSLQAFITAMVITDIVIPLVITGIVIPPISSLYSDWACEFRTLRVKHAPRNSLMSTLFY
jgi:hypothetical protein